MKYSSSSMNLSSLQRPKRWEACRKESSGWDDLLQIGGKSHSCFFDNIGFYAQIRNLLLFLEANGEVRTLVGLCFMISLSLLPPLSRQWLLRIVSMLASGFADPGPQALLLSFHQTFVFTWSSLLTSIYDFSGDDRDTRYVSLTPFLGTISL